VLGRSVKWWFPGRYFGLHHKNRALAEWPTQPSVQRPPISQTHLVAFDER
jgi:hypothetical protein